MLGIIQRFQERPQDFIPSTLSFAVQHVDKLPTGLNEGVMAIELKDLRGQRPLNIQNILSVDDDCANLSKGVAERLEPSDSHHLYQIDE